MNQNLFVIIFYRFFTSCRDFLRSRSSSSALSFAFCLFLFGLLVFGGCRSRLDLLCTVVVETGG